MKYFFNILSLSLTAVFLIFCIGCFNAYFYPMKYKENIVEIAEKTGVESALIASIANVESNFKEGAISNKGAVGIMQIMPRTAEWIAGINKIKYEEDMLQSASYNIELGSLYLAYLINFFDDVQLGICAYNAGQGNVQSWLSNSEYSINGKALKKIPFKETQNYLVKVNKNYHYYKNRYN